MKKNIWVKVAAVATLMVVLTGCSTGKKESANSSEKSQESSVDVSSGASEKSYTDPKELKDSYDIVIIGSGGAGMSAAIEAKEAGLNPVIFEKMPIAGGNTSKASSGMNASETKVQKEQGITDSNDKFYEETLKGGHNTNNPELLRYFVDNSAAAIDWLDTLGIKLNNLTITGGMNEKRTHRPEDGSAVGQYLVDGLLKNVHEKNIPIFVNADVVDIKKDGDKVSGVSVVFDNKDKKEIKGNAVVVTTGGYGANSELIEKARPDLKGYVTTNQVGSTGDGIKMIEKLGGVTVDMDQIQVHPTVQQDKGVLIGEVVRGEGGILVSQAGQRFVNELDTRDNVTKAINELPEKSAYIVFDAGVRERAKAIDFYEKQGYVKEGATIEELAKNIDMPAAELKATLETWNADVASKEDQQFGRKTAMDNDLSKGPFYAIKIAPGIHYTMGGVKINKETQVLDKNDQPITGLYAAGEVTGGLHGENRIGGNSVAEIIIFGRQAGQQSADFVKATK